MEKILKFEEWLKYDGEHLLVNLIPTLNTGNLKNESVKIFVEKHENIVFAFYLLSNNAKLDGSHPSRSEMGGYTYAWKIRDQGSIDGYKLTLVLPDEKKILKINFKKALSS